MARKLSKITGVNPAIDPGFDCKDLVVSDRNIGIEVELENVPQRLDPSEEYELLILEEDGSLRDNGIEIKTPPIQGTRIIQALGELDSWVAKRKVAPEDSERTGLHIHVDMRDTTVPQLVNVLVTYIIMEKVLFGYCGKDRESNPYCTPLGNATSRRDRIYLGSLFSKSDNDILDVIYNHPKYSALNLKPLGSLGTIEFRLHKGTHNTAEILQWANIVLSLVDFGINYTKSPQTIIDSVCSGADTLLDNVFRGHLRTNYTELYDDMLYGARIIQEIYRTKEFSAVENSLLSKLYAPTRSKKKKADKIAATDVGEVWITAPTALYSRNTTGGL